MGDWAALGLACVIGQKRGALGGAGAAAHGKDARAGGDLQHQAIDAVFGEGALDEDVAPMADQAKAMRGDKGKITCRGGAALSR